MRGRANDATVPCVLRVYGDGGREQGTRAGTRVKTGYEDEGRERGERDARATRGGHTHFYCAGAAPVRGGPSCRACVCVCVCVNGLRGRGTRTWH
eukprot:6509160-Prymnesium_polylepis.1